jgi:ABC-type bacteriocin/lantibiotic exporter with double-glycine peptidase domain
MFVDHYVTVMGFKGDKILVGDPLGGLDEMTVADFLKEWTHVAILMRKKQLPRQQPA